MTEVFVDLYKCSECGSPLQCINESKCLYKCRDCGRICYVK